MKLYKEKRTQKTKPSSEKPKENLLEKAERRLAGFF